MSLNAGALDVGTLAQPQLWPIPTRSVSVRLTVHGAHTKSCVNSSIHNVSTTASSWHSHNGRDLCQQGPMQNVPACCSQQAYAASTHPHLKLAWRVLSRTLENTKEDTTHYTGAKRSLGTAWTSAMHLSKNNIPRTARVEPVQKPAMMAFHGSSF